VAREPVAELDSLVDSVMMMEPLIGPEAKHVDAKVGSAVHFEKVIVLRDLERLGMDLAKQGCKGLELSDVMAIDVLEITSRVVELNSQDRVLVVLDYGFVMD
jgi:hypothetical protein